MTIRFHKLTAWLLTVAILLSALPIFVIQASAASISSSYTYKIKVKNSDERNAGTDNTVSCIIETYSGQTLAEKLDSSANDFERNDCRTYSFSLSVQPWDIERVGLKHSGGHNAVRIDWFEFYLPSGYSFRTNTNRWFNRESKTYNVSSSTDRQIKTRGNFDTAFNKTLYYSPATTSGQSNITMEWNGKVSDQYFSTEYKAMDYTGDINLTFTASGTAYGGSAGKSSITNVNQLVSNRIATVDTYKIDIDTNKLLSHMKNNGIFKLTIKSTLNYDDDMDEYGSASKTCTIYRTGFTLGNATAVSPAYWTNYKYFYNSQPDYKTFTVKFPVEARDNYDNKTLATSLASNIKSTSSGTTAKIYYDTVESGKYVTPIDAYASSGYVYLVCNTPSGFANEDEIPLTVVLENAKASYNGREYTLDTTNSRYSSMISNYAIDTKGLTHIVKNTDGEVIDAKTGFDFWQKEVSFKVDMEGGDPYIDDGFGGRYQYRFSYLLYDANTGSNVAISKHNGYSTTIVPHAGNSVYKIIPTSKVEGEYILKISSRDYANNLETAEIPVLIDMIAPRASYKLNQKTLTDGSMRNEYTFTISEKSGTGRLYYAFVRDGYSIPDSTQTKPGTSGPEDTQYERWGFIDQTNNVNTIVLALPKGEYFNGKLYWYTTDGAGNDSRTEKNSGSDNDGYYYATVSLNNITTECDIVIDDATPGNPSYDISFETNANNTVEYKWVGDGVVSRTYTYTDSSKPGQAHHYDSNSNSLLLNGEYTLEYTVVAPDGTRKTYKKDFVFDNSAPTVTIQTPDNNVSDSQSITIKATDISNIESISYRLFTASGDEVGEKVELRAELPVVTNSVVVSPEQTGAYKIEVTAVDANGFKTVMESDVFSIRTSAPTIEAFTNNINTEFDGVPITNSQDYSIFVRFIENIKSIDSFDNSQVLVYRVSADGINYGEWMIEDIVNYTHDSGKDDGQINSNIYIDSPIALNGGDNTVYIQAAFTSLGNDPDTISADFIARDDSIKIIYDASPVQYKLRLEDGGKTNNNVTGTLTYSDNYTAAEDIDVYPSLYNGVIEFGETVITENGAVMDIIITDNLTDEWISLYDAVGNETLVPLNVDRIDKDPPEATINASRTYYAGERNDYFLSLWVDKALDSETQFALMEGDFYQGTVDPESTTKPSLDQLPDIDPEEIDDSLFGPTPDNEKIRIITSSVEEGYSNGETNTLYEFRIFADEETLPEDAEMGTDEWYEEWEELNCNNYIVVMKSEDALGNVIKTPVSYGMTLRNATAEVISAKAVPERAFSMTAVSLEMKVPVYILPGDLVPDDIMDMNLPDGRLDTSDNQAILDFAEFVISSAYCYSEEYMIIVDSLGEKPIYFTDEFGRVYKQTVTVKDLDEKPEETDSDPLTVYASFGEELPVNITLMQGEWGDDFDDLEVLGTDSIDAFDFGSGYSLYVVIEVDDSISDNMTISLNNGSFSSSDGSDDFWYDPYFSTETRLVYEVNNTPNSRKIVTYSADIQTGDELSETIGSAFELVIKDTTPPEAEVYYSTQAYTNSDVIVSVFASDFELTTNSDSGDTDTNQDGEFELEDIDAAENAESLGIRSIEVSEFSTEYIYDYEAIEYSEPEQIAELTLTFTENGMRVLRITNMLGLVSYVPIDVFNIDKTEIAEGEHYEVVYYYIDSNGDYVQIEDDDYYKEVIACVELTSEGEWDKEIIVANNLGSFEKVLTSYDDSFTFVLKDVAGNTVDVDVSFDRFDLEGPSIEYRLLETRKTNQPVDVEIRITDMLSEASDLIAYNSDGDELDVDYIRDINDDVTDTVTKVYQITAEESGIYSLTAYDIFGNASSYNFIVNNIDTTKPEITQRMATATEPTTQNVGVKLYYSKPGVVISRIEAANDSQLESGDIIVDYANSYIRFGNNGTVTVWFVDEYGNVGEDVVTVDNIYRTPPSLSAVTELSDDKLSVDISFVKNLDETRNLEDLYIIFGGIVPVETQFDEEGNILSERVLNASEVKFNLVENGTYTFYAYDGIGNVQTINVEVTGIDRTAPVITGISWSYVYIDAEGNEQTATYTLTPNDEYGYSIGEDNYQATNQDITATVTTDSETKFVGSPDDEYSTTHSVIYTADGWFNFYLEKPNQLMDSYGLGLYLIDKEAPVIEDVEDLIFFENPNAGTPYSESLLTYKAYDVRYEITTDLTSEVEIDWGGFKYKEDEFKNNVFDKNKPYTITYTVKDHVGNETVVKRNITLVGLFDTMLRVNGYYPDSSGRIEVLDNTVELTLENFAGTAYARYESGIYTMAQMKNRGTVISPEENGSFKLEGLTEGWYTFYVQTDLMDYFCVSVFVYGL